MFYSCSDLYIDKSSHQSNLCLGMTEVILDYYTSFEQLCGCPSDLLGKYFSLPVITRQKYLYDNMLFSFCVAWKLEAFTQVACGHQWLITSSVYSSCQRTVDMPVPISAWHLQYLQIPAAPISAVTLYVCKCHKEFMCWKYFTKVTLQCLFYLKIWLLNLWC